MKKGMGRRKVEMKKIEKDKALQVCFSKRRQGVFKKASELSLLCGAHVAVIIFSPGGKPYVYAQPSLDYVINTITSSSNPTPPSSLPTHQQRRIDDLNREHAELLARLEAERTKLRELNLSLSELEMRRSNAEGMMSRRTEEISVPLEYANVGDPVRSAADRAGPLAGTWETPMEELEMWEEAEMEGVKEVMSRPPLPPLEYANVGDPLAVMWEEVEMEGMKEVMSRPPTPLLKYANVGVDPEVEERLFSPYFVGGGGGDDCGFFGCEQGFDSIDMGQFFC
ncbi:Agamous-like MADS-box protein AGL62 [Acorus gramineus]|uniref:Agamous-like MADS-box protein AGL62 n=1 Tax=Acorus gramineus TaxID=55184 RepID=A0AAV9BAV2_ACOGR|nr:Agamous-like MADS-box protein AGL62 [Acorus gramineus]